MRDHTTLKAWQSARAVTLATIALCRSEWKPYGSALFAQLQRASLSVQLNIAEGHAFGESPTFARHLAIAYGSAIETGELLRLLVDAGLVDAGKVGALMIQNAASERLLVGLLKRRRPFHHSR